MPRPSRTILTLIVLIVVALGAAAYLVNVPVWLVAAGMVAALGAIALRVGRSRRPQQVPSQAATPPTER